MGPGLPQATVRSTVLLWEAERFWKSAQLWTSNHLDDDLYHNFYKNRENVFRDIFYSFARQNKIDCDIL